MVNDECKIDSLKAFQLYDSARYLMIFEMCVTGSKMCATLAYIYNYFNVNVSLLVGCFLGRKECSALMDLIMGICLLTAIIA